MQTVQDSRVRVFMKIIDERHGCSAADVTTISAFFGLPEARLRLLFKRELGISLATYSRKVRMTHAAELPKRLSLPIKQIASEAGYDDLSNFYRGFRVVHETTPRKVRLAQLLDCICPEEAIATVGASTVGK